MCSEISHIFQFPGLVAVDADTVPHGVITYTLTGADSQYFTLHPHTAEMTTNLVFDAEATHTYVDLQVTAADNGDLNSTVPLTVIIGDENDFSPFFTLAINTSVTVSEAVLPGATVTVVTAQDNDVRGNILNFSLGGIQSNDGGNPFVIDSATGAITIGDGGLDFELSTCYIVTVIVRDSGSPSQSNSAQLLVLLTDVNDNAPEFKPETQQLTLLENSPIGIQHECMQTFYENVLHIFMYVNSSIHSCSCTATAPM